MHPVELIDSVLQNKTSAALQTLINRFDRGIVEVIRWLTHWFLSLEFYWVEYEIASNEDVTAQVTMIERFIAVRKEQPM